MLAHTKKHHISPAAYKITSKKPLEIEEPMTINEALQELCGDLPKWAIALRGLRRREGLTQVEMGKMLKVPQGNLSQMEHGTRPIGKQIAKRLGELFKTDYRIFL